MKVSTSLFEKRSHPELNPKISGWEALNRYKDNPSIFVSFTKLEKLGINPQTEYDTPAGVYFYPLKAAWKKYKLENKEDQPLKDSFPFAAEHPFIQIVQLVNTSKCLIVSKYSYTDYERDLDKLAEYFFFLNESELSSREQAAQRAEVLKVFKSVLRTKRKFVGPATQLMHGTLKYLAKDLKSYPDSFVKSKVNLEKHSLFLTFCLRKILGYEGIIDDKGEGAIHENEPIQAVIFDPRIYTHLRTIHNTPPKGYTSTEGQLIKFISQVANDLDTIVTTTKKFQKHDKYDMQIKKYSKARLTDRVLEDVLNQIPNGDVSGQLRKYSDASEGRTLDEFALGWILPIILGHGTDVLKEDLDSIKFLNELFQICRIRECTMRHKDLFKYNILHLAARYKKIGILKAAARLPQAFGNPQPEDELFTMTEYSGKTPFQLLHYEDKNLAKEFYDYMKLSSVKIFKEHPEAFEVE